MGNKKRWFLTIFMMLLIMCSMNVSAAFTVKKSKVAVPGTLEVGKTFSVKGTLKANQKIARVVVSVIKGSKQLQRYEARPNAKSYNLANADYAISFDKLPAGQYIYRISAFNAKNKKESIVNKKFTVKSTGSKINIVNPSPAKDFSLVKGNGMVVSGKITSKYQIVSVTAKIVNSAGKTVQTKTVSPKKTTYDMSKDKTMDNSMLFDKLEVGSYKFQISVTDSKGTTVLAINRNCTISAGNTSAGAVGSSGGTTNYSDVTGTLPSPAGFTPRTSRPAANNAYYYNGNENIYYHYDSLGPTGKAVTGGYVIGNYTWYACGRAMEIAAASGGAAKVNKVKAIFGGDPVEIFNSNKKLGKFSYGTTPKPGSLAVFNYGGNSGDAHIAVVEAVINGVPYVSESGYKLSATAPYADKSNVVFWYQSIYAWSGGRRLLGYIYLV